MDSAPNLAHSSFDIFSPSNSEANSTVIAAIAVTGASGSFQLMSKFVLRVSRDDEKDVSPVPPTCARPRPETAGVVSTMSWHCFLVAKPRATATNGSSRRTSIACPGTASDAKVRTALLGAATSQSLQ